MGHERYAAIPPVTAPTPTLKPKKEDRWTGFSSEDEYQKYVETYNEKNV
jgi:hypothetical protein